MKKWTRRAFLISGSLLGGGVMLGVGSVLFAPNRLNIEGGDDNAFITTWLQILANGEVIAIVPHCEMGNGTQTSMAMMLADELDVDWKQVRIKEAPAELAYANDTIVRFLVNPKDLPDALVKAFRFYSFKMMQMRHLMLTGGSMAVRLTGQHAMRVAGAAARQMLKTAAAQRWNVNEDECEAKLGFVYHAKTGKKASYGELASLAATLSAPVNPKLKRREDFRIMTKSVDRPDLPSKVDGSCVYGIDTKLPDMLFASVSANPVRGAKLLSVDEAPALKMKGVHKVVKLDDAVAVIAENTWQARQALAVLTPRFSDDGQEGVSSESLRKDARTLLSDPSNGTVKISQGDVEASFAGAKKVLDAEYEVPFQPQATMETMACTGLFKNGKLELWAGTQDPLNARYVGATTLNLSVEDVTMHNLMLGGGFGRRTPGCFDFVAQCAHLAKAVSPRPVKLIWSREEDMQHGFYRPAIWARVRGALDASGKVQGWMGDFTSQPGHDDAVSAFKLPYDIPNQTLKEFKATYRIATGFWRSVEHSWHGFFVESFVDELAHAAGKDPFDFRCDMLKNNPRALKVVKTVAEKADWRKTLPPGTTRGIALVESFDTVVAQVAEVNVSADKTIKVQRVVTAVDCGFAVHPDSVVSQMEGGILFGMTAALTGEITIEGGKVAQRNFHDYEVMRIQHAPQIEVHIVETGAPLGGIGEPGVAPVAPAITNAVFAANGERLRSLPLKKHGYKLA